MILMKNLLKETQAVADKYKGEFGVNFNVSSSTNRKEALKGATVSSYLYRSCPSIWFMGSRLENSSTIWD